MGQSETTMRISRQLVALTAAFALLALPAHGARLWIPPPVQKSAAENDAGQDADIAAGQEVFAKCASCHALSENANDGIGPRLHGIIGRKAASIESYEYSDALASAGKEGLVWSPHFLSTYLKAPNKMLPGNKMPFIGISSEEDRRNLIGYLATFTPTDTDDTQAALENDQPPAGPQDQASQP